MRRQTPNLRIVLIDQDQTFCQMVQSFAHSRGLDLVSFESIESMGSIGRFKDFDVAIIEDNGQVTGAEVGKYFSELPIEITMIIISSGIAPSDQEKFEWCLPIKSFVHKDLGVDAILDAAITAS